MSKPTPRKIAGLGWKPDLPDHRDYKYKVPSHILASLPQFVDLRPGCPSVYDQLTLGSCTANASAAMAQFLFMKEDKKPITPSRLFIYYNARVLEGTPNEDSGATLRDTMTVMNRFGCPEEWCWWWYKISAFAVKPNHMVYVAASQHLLSKYESVPQTLDGMKGCLAEGYPFVFGFTVYDSFFKIGSDGVMPVPAKSEQVQGGHAVMAVGYDDSKQHFIVRNSWGEGWGDKGYFYFPYSLITNNDMCDDFWTGRLVV